MVTANVALNFQAGTATATCIIKAATIAGSGVADTYSYLAETVGDNFKNEVMPGLCNTIKFTTAVIGGLTPHTSTFNTLGGSTSPMAPISVSYLVKKRSAGARDGRMFLPGVTETGISEAGIVTGTLITSLETKLNAWLAATTADGVSLDVEHKGDFDSNIDSFTVDAIIGSQRRRVRR